MDNNHYNPRFTASEMSQIWAAYQNSTLSNCMLTYFLKDCENEQIRNLLETALKMSKEHTAALSGFFKESHFPIPRGFNLEEDIDLSAGRIFSDTYMLLYVNQMGYFGMNAYAASLPLVAKKELYEYFAKCLRETNDIHRRSVELLLSMGLFIRSPYIPVTESVDTVKETSFLTGFFGERRPLTSLEITNLFMNIQRNALGVSTMIGFSQAATAKEVSRYVIKGKEIAAKHVEIFGSVLREQNLPVPMTWDSEVTSTTDAAFSDRLIMFHTVALTAIGMGYYGTSIAASPRRDIASHYTRLMFEVEKYSEEGSRIMIKNQWMEEPPKAPDRYELAMKK